MNKKVSIIIPCFNDRPSISAALESINQQNYEQIEILVIDDCSTESLRLSDISLLSKHPIKLIRNEQNLGANMAINKGFDAASGEYICILAADDVFPTGSITQRVKLLSSGADLVLGATEQIFKNHSKIIRSVDLNSKAIINWLEQKDELRGINNATAMYTDNLRKKTGYRLERGAKGSHEDYEYVLRLFINASKPISTDHVCYVYRMEENSTMYTEIKKDKTHWNVALADLENEYREKIGKNCKLQDEEEKY
jgi:glycosyltransferase involved in cell wall biosynthesis